MTQPQVTVALPQRRRYRVEIAVFTSCLIVVSLFVLLRMTQRGVQWEHRAEYLLGGDIHAFNNMGDLFTYLTQICAACALLTFVLLSLGIRRHPRATFERFILIVSFWVLCLVSGLVAKHTLSHFLGSDVGTLPSGHTTAALAACGAITFAAAGRWREFFVPAAGFMSSLFVVSVVNAYVHRPGDALTAVALCTSWAVCVDLAAGGVRLPRATHELSNRVLVSMGSATALLTTIGWGAVLQIGGVNHIEGWIERLVLTAAGGLYALYLARVADKLGCRLRG